MGMVYGKAAFNAFLEILPIGILLSSKEKGSFSERSFPQNILFCTIAFAETKSPTASREQKLSLAELRCATSGFEAVLREFLSCFSLIFPAFPAFCFSVIRCADHKKRPFFIQRQTDETHHLLPQTAPLVYCTSLLHRCP